MTKGIPEKCKKCAIASASQSPNEADLLMVFNLLDLTLVELDTRSQLRVAGDAVGIT